MKQTPQHTPRFARFLLKVALASLATGSLIAPTISFPAQATLENSPKTVVDEVWQIVNNEFVDQSFNQQDWHSLRRELLTRDYSSSQEAYAVVRQLLKRLGDPYTRFLDPKQFEVLTSQTSGELSGVGISLEVDEKTQYLQIVETLENSPAQDAGLRSGDKIVKINNQLTALMSLEQASEMIRGQVGTEVTLEISRESLESFEITLTRAQIELPAVNHHFTQEGEFGVGYIRLDEFSSHAAEQMKQAIQELNRQDIDGFVLDLRGNPGGLLFASVDIARMWMNSGTIVTTIDRKGGNQSFSANSTALTNLPLVVLVNERSASASEILAGALKDNGRATIVGTQTFGKGTVQSVHSLSDGSGLAVTISRYYPPSGININKEGITPDISLNLTGDQKRILQNNPNLFGTLDDPQYAEAISILQGQTYSLTPGETGAFVESRQHRNLVRFDP